MIGEEFHGCGILELGLGKPQQNCLEMLQTKSYLPTSQVDRHLNKKKVVNLKELQNVYNNTGKVLCVIILFCFNKKIQNTYLLYI